MSPRSTTAVRRRAQRFGRLAEGFCAWHLRLKGYRVLARGFRTPFGEIDIIAQRGGTVAMIEVKARRDFDAAVQALGRRQRDRIVRAARMFLQTRPGLAESNLRFDIMLVEPWRLPRHLADAWRIGE